MKKNAASSNSATASSSTSSVAPFPLPAIARSTTGNPLPTYPMFHLLVAGSRGTEYQLLVLLERMLYLREKKRLFSAQSEAKDTGNLDDIVLEAHNPAQIEGYQIKFYDHPLEFSDFFNLHDVVANWPSKKKKETATCHIGKFFAGWLSLRNRYSAMPAEQINAIIYTNASLDNTLASLIKTGTDHLLEDFSNHNPSYQVSISYTLNRKSSTHTITDIYQFLFTHAWLYLNNHQDAANKFATEKSYSDAQKSELFAKFLKSIRFKSQQPTLESLKDRIMSYLSQINGCIADLLFMNLYYALYDWFLHPPADYQQTVLTSQIFDRFIQEAETRAHTLLLLQGRTAATLDNTKHLTSNIFVPREEIDTLAELIKQRGIIVISGEKGIGKSSLVKQLVKDWHKNTYLMISAKDLITNKDLLPQLLSVLKDIKLKLVCIDGAEILPQLPDGLYHDLIEALKAFAGCAVLTSTRPYLEKAADTSKIRILSVAPLSIQRLLENFPMLTPYQSIMSIMQRAQIPFYLNAIVATIQNGQEQRLNTLAILSTVQVEYHLIKFIVEGNITTHGEGRLLVWRMLSGKLAHPDDKKDFLTQINKTKIRDALNALIQDKIISVENGDYVFCHDLFFAFGIASFLQHEFDFGNNDSLWNHLTLQLTHSRNHLGIQKWFAINDDNSDFKERLLNDYYKKANNDSKKLLLFLAASISPGILRALLAAKLMALNEVFSIGGELEMTYMLAAIKGNNHEALALLTHDGALPYHPIHDFPIPASPPLQDEENDSLENDSDIDEEYEKDPNEDDDEDNASSENNDFYYNYSDDNSSVAESVEDTPLVNEDTNELDVFIGNPVKYWQSGFYQPQYISHEEYDDWGEVYSTEMPNPEYQESTNYNYYYLHTAVMLDHVECLRFLWEQKELKAIYTRYQESLWHMAAYYNANRCAEFLVSIHLPMETLDEWGETPLHNAAYQGASDICVILIKKYANIDKANTKGLTPLHIALAAGNFDVAKQLTMAGANWLIHPFFCDDYSTFDLLDAAWEKHFNDQDAEIFEKFIRDLIEYFNYGWNDKGTKKDDEREKIVDALIAFLSCAELSDLTPDFNYYDEQSKLEYIVELYPDFGELHYLTHVILSDPENIDYVLTSSSFETDANILLDEWFEYAQTEDSYYRNLRRYACDYNNHYLLDLFRNYEKDYQAACEKNQETFPYSPLPSPRGTPSPAAS